MPFIQPNIPKRLNLDKAEKYLAPDEAFFLLNHDINNDENLQSATPLGGNYLACEMDLPLGETYSVGSYYNQIVNEEYSWKYNSNGVHFITRIKGDGECDVVYEGCLDLDPDPKHKITPNRAHLHINRLCNKVEGGVLKQLIWVDGKNEIGCLDIEASIATNSFTTPFFNIGRDDCAMVQLCVPQPLGCLHGEFIPKPQLEKSLPNYLMDKGFKAMYQFEYYDGRKSEWSDRSTLFFQNARGCFDSTDGFSRCILFNVPLGNPMVDKIHIGISDDGGTTYYLYDTIQKYEPYKENAKWYERGLSSKLEVDYDSLTFKYYFYNDRERLPISPTSVNRVYSPIPKKTQCLLPMPKGAVGYVNYEKGFCPLEQKEADKIKVSVSCATQEEDQVEMVEVKVRAVIYNFFFARHSEPNYEWRNIFIGDNDKVLWGVPDPSPKYDQYFPEDGITNFTAYIEGTTQQVQMKQFKVLGFQNGVQGQEVDKIFESSGAGDDEAGVSLAHQYRTITPCYQEATFLVRKGTKGIIRLSSHLTSKDTNTSTQVAGTFNIAQANSYRLNGYVEGKYEIEFDTCDMQGNTLLLSEAFVIEDLFTVQSNLANIKTYSSAYSGYVYDEEGLPYEGAHITHGGSGAVTDHNGFYFFYKVDGDSYIVANAYGETDCGDFQFIGNTQARSGEGQMGKADIKLTNTIRKGAAEITVKLEDCDGNPVEGVRVALSNSKYRVTDPLGMVTFKARNFESRDRTATVYLMDKGSCIIKDCNGRNEFCFPSLRKKLPTCFLNPFPIGGNVQVDMGTMVVNSKGVGDLQKGLKHGGRYPFGFVLEGRCGVMSSVNKINYLDIPPQFETKTSSFCDLTFSISEDIELPKEVDTIKLVRGENIDDFVLQWVVDEVERAPNGQIKLTIQSLNDYNAFYNFKTNTNYQFTDKDRVVFIKNGDGTYFESEMSFKVLSPFNDKVVSGVTDAPAEFFNQILLQDNSKLSYIKKGAIIEIKRPKAHTDKPSFFEICASIPVIDGKPLVYSGKFETFDTYLVLRQIGTKPPLLLEHFAPTDFYLSQTKDDRGKVHFTNEFANRKRFGRNITVASPEQINYFGEIEKTFDVAEQGDIVGINVKDEKIGLVISEKDNALFSISDDLLRIGSDNVVRAATPDQLISSPQAKLSGMYGCNYEDVGSILFGDGFALWIDRNANDYIIHNYQEARIAGGKNTNEGTQTTCSSWVRKKIRHLVGYNDTVSSIDKCRVITGMDKRKNRVYLTIKKLQDSGINNTFQANSLPNETIVFDPKTNDYVGFASFTPEDYSFVELNNYDGCSFITYQSGLPYIHPLVPDKWNEFFGVACDWAFGIALNAELTKVKKPLAVELQSTMPFFVANVTSESETYRSEIPMIKWEELIKNKWNASFLNNINSRGGLYEGEKSSGFYFNVLFVRDNTLNSIYNSVDDEKRVLFSKLDNVIFKFLTVEQSGFKQ